MSETSAVNATEKTSNRFELLLRAASAALLVVATIISAGLTVYYGNSSEFPFNISSLYLLLSITGFLLFLFLFLVQFPFKKTLYFCIANYLVFCVGICLYFQSNWFLWDLGPLMAGEFWWDWAEHGKNTIIETGFYIVLIALFIWGRKWLYNNLVKISFVIIAVEIICLFPMTLKPKEDFTYMYYSVDKTKKFEFAKDKNIIIFVIDCFSTPLMEELLRQSPELKDDFSDFTMYPKLFTEKNRTLFAVPAIMTGVYLDNITNEALEKCYYDKTKSIILKMKNTGYKTEVYPLETWADGHMVFYYDRNLMSNLIPRDDEIYSSEIKQGIHNYIYAICLRISPLRIKSIVSRNCCDIYSKLCLTSSNNQEKEESKLPDNAKFYRQLKEQACIGAESRVFKYYHIRGVHLLFETDENLNPLPVVSPSTITREYYFKQAKGCIKIMKELISQLKALGIYDNSAIIFMGDHGRMEEVMGLKGDIAGEHNPMLLVKMFHEKHSQMHVYPDILLQTDICQVPLWTKPDDVSSNYKWGSEFDSKQKDERLAIWKSYQNKEAGCFFVQTGKFELEKKTIDFSDKVLWDIEIPRVEDSNLCGFFWLKENPDEQCSILLVNDKSVYSVPIRIQEFAYYCCDVSNVSDGEYEMDYMLESEAGQKLFQFPHCKIIVKNKKPVVVKIEEE